MVVPRLVQCGGKRIVQTRVCAGQGTDVGNAAAHGTGAHHTDDLDHRPAPFLSYGPQTDPVRAYRVRLITVILL